MAFARGPHSVENANRTSVGLTSSSHFLRSSWLDAGMGSDDAAGPRASAFGRVCASGSSNAHTAGQHSVCALVDDRLGRTTSRISTKSMQRDIVASRREGERRESGRGSPPPPVSTNFTRCFGTCPLPSRCLPSSFLGRVPKWLVTGLRFICMQRIQSLDFELGSVLLTSAVQQHQFRRAF